MKDLPPVLTAYFNAADAGDAEAVAACFAPGATVRDEGETHRGHERIAAWNRAVTAKYACAHTVKGWTPTAEGADVTAEVAGTFPGSPITLTFRFALRDGKIGALEIG